MCAISESLNGSSMNLTISFATHLCNTVFSDEIERKSRSVMARLKESEWRSKRTPEAKDFYHTKSIHNECSCVAGTMLAEESHMPRLPEYDVFLGGSCGTTRSSIFLFVIDPATVNATSFLEIAYFAARKSPKLVVVFLGKTEWKQKAHPSDLPDRNRTSLLLDRILDAHDVPMLYSIQDALDYIEEEIIGRKRWSEVLCVPCQRLSYLSLRTKRVIRAAHYTARGAWLRMRSFARRMTLAGVADMVIFIACQMIAPNIPIYFVLIPLLLLSLIIIIAAERWQRYRLRYPRAVADSSHLSPRAAAAIPSPRMATVVRPLNFVHAKKNLVRSKRFCDSIVEDGSSSFIVPDLLRRHAQHKQMINMSSSTTIELASSAPDESSWVNKVAVPHMDRHNLRYSLLLVMSEIEPECRMRCLLTWASQLKHFLYLIPTTKTFLSGMVEVAYILGHTNWQITLCVPKEAEILEAPPTIEDELERASRRRRNDCYQIAFCYLKDMAKRRQCRVFSELDDALLYVAKVSFHGL
ncbi:hypothetical protein GCK32_000576 [Trichostrongylus colubriformis]|uniref:Uncharacterized protein n=1 Tax=Trichostrongylus colubriformis TaxID=6319 RepID=A0AAN8FE13_TRICO